MERLAFRALAYVHHVGRVGSTGAGRGKDNRHSTVCRSWRTSLRRPMLAR